MSNPTFPPGPNSGFFGLKTVTEFNTDALDFMTRISTEYDDIVHHKFGPFHAYLLNHPDLIRQVLVRDAGKFLKWDRQKKVMSKVAGNGILISDGDFWKRQRRLVQPAFHTQRIKNYAEIMVELTTGLLDRWADGATVDLYDEMTDLTMSVIGKVLFDVDVREEARHIAEAITVTQEMTVLEMINILHVPDWVPTPRNLRENRAMKDLRDYLMDIIQQRRASGEDKGDLLSMLILAQDEDGQQMTDEQVYDEAVTLFVAGHETMASALTWMWYHLSQNPDVLAKLRAEVDGVLNGRAPTLDDLDAMHYTDMTFKEAMRVAPSIWIFHREAAEDVEIGGYTIPKGSIVYVSPWAMHHHPRFWDEPETFRPERFADKSLEREMGYTYFPFGGGPRVCVGQHLAMMEAEIITAMMVERVDLTLVPGQTVEPQPLIAVRPKDGLKMTVRKR